MSYSFLVWNVENFHGEPNKLQEIENLLQHFDPDIFGIVEFESKKSARSIVDDFDKYDFAFTDSKQAIEILVGWKRGKFDQVIYTQRREFMSKSIHLRPGGLLSVKQKNNSFFDNLLFLHGPSGKSVTRFDQRKEMIKKIWKMKKSIESLPIQQGNARFIALGDYNTMGRSKTDTKPTVLAKTEVDKLKNDAQRKGMRALVKSKDRTFSNRGGRESELDYVIASDDLSFETNSLPDADNNPFEIEIFGWNKKTGPARISFIDKISDHCALFGKVV